MLQDQLLHPHSDEATLSDEIYDAKYIRCKITPSVKDEWQAHRSSLFKSLRRSNYVLHVIGERIAPDIVHIVSWIQVVTNFACRCCSPRS